ncbi:pentapeptide repeat-containing protein (plasmid) [Nitratireductor sp. GZWM139]|nr:pentapeptide repeat-containing protein [Nitratireductor sp. GZWM139]
MSLTGRIRASLRFLRISCKTLRARKDDVSRTVRSVLGPEPLPIASSRRVFDKGASRCFGLAANASPVSMAGARWEQDNAGSESSFMEGRFEMISTGEGSATLADQELGRDALRQLTGSGAPVVLRNCVLEDADLSRLDMEGWHFEECNLTRTCFDGAQLDDAAFVGCRAAKASFVGAKMTDARIEGSDFSNTNFRRATLTSAVITGCKMLGADLTEVRSLELQLEEVLLRMATLPSFSFRKKVLKRVDFGEADLRMCDFRGATFEGCSLRGANLADCRFELADLRDTDLGEIKLTDARRFRGAMISRQQAAELLEQLGLLVF